MKKISKKEQARLEAEAEQKRIDAAFCRITEPRPVPMVYEEENPDGAPWGWLMVGWHVHCYLGGMGGCVRVSEGCSNGTFHSTYKTTKTDSQQRGTFYRTEREALVEGRYRLQEECAKELARVDKMLEETKLP